MFNIQLKNSYKLGFLFWFISCNLCVPYCNSYDDGNFCNNSCSSEELLISSIKFVASIVAIKLLTLTANEGKLFSLTYGVFLIRFLIELTIFSGYPYINFSIDISQETFERSIKMCCTLWSASPLRDLCSLIKFSASVGPHIFVDYSKADKNKGHSSGSSLKRGSSLGNEFRVWSWLSHKGEEKLLPLNRFCVGFVEKLSEVFGKWRWGNCCVVLCCGACWCEFNLLLIIRWKLEVGLYLLWSIRIALAVQIRF